MLKRKLRTGKTLLAAFLVFIMIAMILPVAAFAAGETVENVRSISITKNTTQEELDAWAEGAAVITGNPGESRTITLNKNISLASGQNINFGQFDYTGSGEGASQPYLTLDLNGHTITGLSIVLTNYGNLIIEDSSEEQTGEIIYDGGAYFAAVQNAGYNLQIKGGAFVCNGAGASGYNAAVNTAANTTTIIDGGTFQGNNATAVISYGDTTINGGDFYGKYGVAVKVGSEGNEGKIEFPADSTAVVNADAAAFYRIEGTGANQDKAGTIVAGGGDFNAPQIVKENTGTIPSTTVITGGSYEVSPVGYVPDGNAIVGYTAAGDQSVSYLVGTGEIEQAAASATAGAQIEILAGSVNLSITTDGVEVINSGDGNVIVNDTEIQKNDGIFTHSHLPAKTEAKAASCTEKGNIAYWYCEGCGKYFSDEACTTETTLEATVIPAKGHGETEIKNAKDATCTEEGYTGDKVCKDCGEVIEQGKAIAKVAHTYKDGKCTACGAADPNYKPSTTPEPSKPEKENSSISEGEKQPETGDSAPIIFWAALLFISAGAAVLVLFLNKNEKIKM